ncbi:Type III restriction-modification system methylation subunit [Moraxella catarrhalis]|uniref:site-specific DNA-methyltransferase n=1 Tax=Moraxella catarrhalis TaxID=480 RepID=UPI0007F53446|nr:DNA methyltransferase [Moraxella catarrhalis]OAV11212.1 Type III restriction-modification system methylation subunit [Moraxella catarrhalis]
MTLPTEHLFADTGENSSITLLKQHFPQCFDKDGLFLPDKLAEQLQTANVPVSREYYTMNWLGKSYARYLCDCPPITLLGEDSAHNTQSQNQHSQNLLIKGDNLEVLKHLKNAYANQVKMIYIDPPYNTGSDGFVYQDDRKFTPDELAKLADMSTDEARRVLDFTAKKSNSHSAWLTFMYPRLYIARELLKEDGVIFISIDDNEQAQLKLLCDEVFGEENFVACIPWRKRTAKSDVPFGVSQDYEWILCFAKSAQFIASIQGKERRYYETDDFPNRPWRIHDLTKQTTSTERPNSFFTMIDPKTGKEYPANPNATWRVTKDTFQDYYDNGKIVFPDDYDFLKISRPVMRYFKDDDMRKAGDNFGNVAVGTKLPDGVGSLADAVAEYLGFLNRSLADDIGMTKDGTKEISDIFGSKIFSFPKPSSLINFLAEIATKSNDLILDFFAGSGTTAHAVMQLNAQDNGNRRFICVQLDEPTDPKSEARKAGYPTIFEITKERIIRSAQKIKSENPDYQGDLGFKIFETMPDFRATNDEISPQLEFPEMLHANLEPKQYETLLTTWCIYDGNALTQSVQSVELGGYSANLCGTTLYVVYPDFDSVAIKALLDKLDHDADFIIERIVLFGEMVESAKQRELKQALDTYNNKKNVHLSLLVRY